MDIKGSTPKEIEYINKLLFEYSEGRSWRDKIRNPTQSYEGRTKTEIAGELTHETDSYLGEFLDQLIKADVLKKVGYKKNAANKRPTYKLDKAALRKAFSKTVFYIENKELFIDVLDKEEGAFVWN